MVMVLFVLQPLKYIKNTKIWYLIYVGIFVILSLFSILISSLIEGKFVLNTSIIENLDTSSNLLLIIGITVLFVSTVIGFFN